MNDRGARETAGKAVALLIVVALAVALVGAALAQAAPQPALPLVTASGCEPVNPCLTMVCTAPKGPFGGTDPDAGERDNRRIA